MTSSVFFFFFVCMSVYLCTHTCTHVRLHQCVSMCTHWSRHGVCSQNANVVSVLMTFSSLLMPDAFYKYKADILGCVITASQQHTASLLVFWQWPPSSPLSALVCVRLFCWPVCSWILQYTIVLPCIAHASVHTRDEFKWSEWLDVASTYMSVLLNHSHNIHNITFTLKAS